MDQGDELIAYCGEHGSSDERLRFEGVAIDRPRGNPFTVIQLDLLVGKHALSDVRHVFLAHR